MTSLEAFSTFSTRVARLQALTAGLDPIEVCVYETRTGTVRRWLPLADWPDWERGINGEGTWSCQVPLDDRYLSKSQITAYTTPWHFSWAIVQGTHIWQAGPVLGEDYVDGATSTQVSGVGMLGFLARKRVLLNPARATRRGAAAIDADIAFGPDDKSPVLSPIPPENKNLALASIAARLVQLALSEPGGDLPIDVASTTIPGTAERTYPGYDLGYVGQRLIELSQVDGGPELDFRPYFVTPDRRQVRHQMLVGNPRLGVINPSVAPVWDSGRALVTLGVRRDGADQIHRQYQRGSGMDRNTLIGFAENMGGVTSGPSQLMPLLEGVESAHSQVELQATLDSYAAADVATNATPDLTLTPTVRIAGDDGRGRGTRSPHLTQVAPGSVGVLEVRGHPRLDDGSYRVRVLRFRSARSATDASMEVQLLSYTTTGGGT